MIMMYTKLHTLRLGKVSSLEARAPLKFPVEADERRFPAPVGGRPASATPRLDRLDSLQLLRCRGVSSPASSSRRR